MPLVDCESSDISCGLGFSYKASSFATDIFKDIVPPPTLPLSCGVDMAKWRGEWLFL
jgi:hypothetical protein